LLSLFSGADVFRNFFTEHAEIFEEAPALTGGEHDLNYYNLFNVYLKLYEGTLVSYLKTLKVSIEEFYRDVRDAQAEEPDPYLQVPPTAQTQTTDPNLSNTIKLY
jgi:hypothetical protein